MVASCLQKIELWYPSFGLQVLIVTLVVLYSERCKSVKNCRDSDFSNGGLEAGLPAFQLPMLAKCDALPKKDLCIFMRHVCLRNPCFCGNLSLHSLPEAWGPWELQHAPPPHYGCIMLAKDRVVVSKLWITGIDCDLSCFIQRALQVSEELPRFGF